MIALAESGHHHPVNIGNPDEFTLLELAHAVIEVTGSSSEIVYEALPTDDPQQRKPDITLAKDLLGWEPRGVAARGAEADDRPGRRRGTHRSRQLEVRWRQWSTLNAATSGAVGGPTR